VADHPGLRQRQAQRTREAIQDAATRLFLASGFHAVSVDEIAAAAEVSKRTLFKYFPSKEDLVIGGFADHADEATQKTTREDGDSLNFYGSGVLPDGAWERGSVYSITAWQLLTAACLLTMRRQLGTARLQPD